MDLTKDLDAAVLLERIACWTVFASILLLSSYDVLKILPNNETLLIVPILFELLSIAALLRIRDSSLVRDLIDLSIYALIYKIIFLLCFNGFYPAFIWLKFYFHPIFLPWLGLIAFTRLLFFPKPADTLHLVDWPRIGVYGWLMPKGEEYLAGNAIPTLNWFRIGAAVIISLELAVILTGCPSSWSFVLTAVVGLEIVAFRIYPFDSAIRSAFVQKNAAIAYYQNMVSQAASVITRLTGGENKPD